MKDNFTPSLGFVLRWECAFAPGHYGDSAYVVAEDVPGDSGGVTKWGIDQRDHPGVDIRNLTFDQAAAIYQNGEWATCLCDALPMGIDTAVFDAAVNNGCRTSAMLLQQACNRLGYKLDVDGAIGSRTVAAVMAICATTRWNLVEPLLDLRRQHYQMIVNAHTEDVKFLTGWLNRVDDLEKFLKGGVA